MVDDPEYIIVNNNNKTIQEMKEFQNIFKAKQV